MGWSLALYLVTKNRLITHFSPTLDCLLLGESCLGGRRYLLEHKVILKVADAKLDRGIPIITIEEIVVKPLNDVVNGAL